jgi:SAM-dependent methyltransferase
LTAVADQEPDRVHWERVAREWTAWARKPGHDAFWSYRAALAEFVGPGSGEALDVGCGEGRVSRELKALGWRVTATDAVAAMVEAAREIDSADDYAVAPATALPFADGRFALVVAYNVLMDVDDVPAAVKEMRRVMRADGTLVVSIVHPFFDCGRFAGEEADAPFVIDGAYFGRRRFEGVEERDGLAMHFAGWSQPLQSYAAALEGAGLAITSLVEPQPDRAAGRAERWARLPLFLWMKARVLAG